MKPIYIVGGGSVGAPLAAFLASMKRPVRLVRTRPSTCTPAETPVLIANGENSLSANVTSVSLDDLDSVDGIIVITSKAHANREIAKHLRRKYRAGPVIVAQNGLNVEREFKLNGFPHIGRAVLYLTSEPQDSGGAAAYIFRSIAPSLVGGVLGDKDEIKRATALLNTENFPFAYTDDLVVPVYKKAIVNVVFNSICPLLDVDNGIFARDPSLAPLVNSLVDECLQVTKALSIPLSAGEIQEQVAMISRKSRQFISTLQDIRAGRKTEIDFLNFEFIRLAKEIDEAIEMPLVRSFGELVKAKSELGQTDRPRGQIP